MIFEIVKNKNILCKTIHFKCKKTNEYNIYSRSGFFVKFHINKKYDVFQLNSELIKHLVSIMNKMSKVLE